MPPRQSPEGRARRSPSAGTPLRPCGVTPLGGGAVGRLPSDTDRRRCVRPRRYGGRSGRADVLQCQLACPDAEEADHHGEGGIQSGDEVEDRVGSQSKEQGRNDLRRNDVGDAGEGHGRPDGPPPSTEQVQGGSLGKWHEENGRAPRSSPKPMAASPPVGDRRGPWAGRSTPSPGS